MDVQAYNDAVSSATNQKLGGKEMRFPVVGLSDTVPSSRLCGAYTPAAFNVIFRAPYNLDSCGGTRPGLKAFSGDVPISQKTSHWLWPNGEPILWPDGDNMAFAELGSKVIMPDGSALFKQHEVFDVSASKGNVPAECSAFAWYRDRFVVASGNMWYASRSGVHDDFDYGGDGDDVSRAAAGSVALAGREGETITALAAIADNSLIIATKRSIWRASGEPTLLMSQISDNIGIISRDAWCWDGMRFWFLGPNGLYVMVLGEPPVLVTPHLNHTLSGLGSATLVFDPERNGIHILMPYAMDGFYDISNKAYWPVIYPASKRPTGGGVAMLDGKNRVVFLCADNAFRYWDEDQDTDDGTAIPSACAFGPITHTTGNTEQAFLAELDFEFDDSITAANGVAISGYVGNTSNAVIELVQNAIGEMLGPEIETVNEKFRYSVSPGWNHVVRPRVRCNSFSPVVWSTGGRWAISKITAVHRGCGRIRR